MEKRVSVDDVLFILCFKQATAAVIHGLETDAADFAAESPAGRKLRTNVVETSL